MADRSGNTQAVLGLFGNIAGTLRDVKQMRMNFALQKAKMSRDERLRVSEQDFQMQVEDYKADKAKKLQEQKNAFLMQQQGVDQLGRYNAKFDLTDEQEQDILSGKQPRGQLKQRPNMPNVSIYKSQSGGGSNDSEESVADLLKLMTNYENQIGNIKGLMETSRPVLDIDGKQTGGVEFIMPKAEGMKRLNFLNSELDRMNKIIQTKHGIPPVVESKAKTQRGQAEEYLEREHPDWSKWRISIETDKLMHEYKNSPYYNGVSK